MKWNYTTELFIIASIKLGRAGLWLMGRQMGKIMQKSCLKVGFITECSRSIGNAPDFIQCAGRLGSSKVKSVLQLTIAFRGILPEPWKVPGLNSAASCNSHNVDSAQQIRWRYSHSVVGWVTDRSWDHTEGELMIKRFSHIFCSYRKLAIRKNQSSP